MSILGRIRTGDQLDQMEFPPLSWAVHGVIPEGFGLLTGAPKAGKSWCVLEIGLAVASGGNALGKIPTGRERPVLYFALEDGERRLQGRARHLLGEGVPIPPNLHYLIDGTPAEVMAAIPEWLEIYGRTNPLVVLDTLGKVMPPALPGEGAYQRDYRVGTRFKELVGHYPGTTILVVHHVRKASGEDWMDSTSGTNGLNGSADFTLNLARSRNEDSGVLRVTGRDVPESEYAITNNSGRWTIDGQALADAAEKARHLRAVDNLGDRSAEIVEFVCSQTEPVTAKTVDDALDIKDARRYLTRLVDAGRLTRPGRGLYAPVPSVPSVPSGSGITENGTHGTHGTRTCTACNFPLDPAVVAEGFTTHPACEESA